MPEPILISTDELAAKYGFTSTAWRYWLNKWRLNGDLVYGETYMMARGAFHAGGTKYMYLEKRVMRLVWNLPKDTFFRQEIVRLHGDTIRNLYTPDNSTTPE